MWSALSMITDLSIETVFNLLIAMLSRTSSQLDSSSVAVQLVLA